MKRVCIILLSLFCTIHLAAQETSLEKVVPKVLIDGYFFISRPESLPVKTSMAILKDSEGNKVSSIRYLDGATLSDWSKLRAIPFENVQNGPELLELAKNARYTTMSLSTANIKAGDKFPKFKEQDIEGKRWSSDELAGKCFLINLWSITCKPCIAEMPAISKWKERYPSVHFFSATYNTAEEALPIIQRRNFTYTHLVNVSDTIMDLVGKAGFPCTIIVDRNGTVVHIESGTSPKQLYDLEETLKQLHNQHK